MTRQTRGLIHDVRQMLLRLPLRVAWIIGEGEAVARTVARLVWL